MEKVITTEVQNISHKIAFIGLVMALYAPFVYGQGVATFYTVASCKREGTSGVFTASGERYIEGKMTCALRSRDFGGLYRVTNKANGRSVVVRHNDYGPGKGPTKRGVVIDLSPASFDALGGRRGETWGEINVSVERIK